MEQLNLRIKAQLTADCEPSGQNCQPNLKTDDNSSLLSKIWGTLLKDYFPARVDLLAYQISWSPRRQKRTLASCNLRAKRILVAQELNKPDYQWVLYPLIYHELCHAVLGYSVRSESGKSRWHGREFRQLERRHPEISTLNNWIKAGGWRQAIRRHRGSQSARIRIAKTRSLKSSRPKKKPIRSSLLSRFLKYLK